MRIHLHPIVKSAPEQPAHRQARSLAADIPQGDVDRADRGDHRARATVVAGRVIHAVREDFGVARIRAEQQRCQRMLDGGGGDRGRLQPLRERLAPAGDAGVGGNLDDRRRALPDPSLRESERMLGRRPQRVNGDAGDFYFGQGKAVLRPWMMRYLCGRHIEVGLSSK